MNEDTCGVWDDEEDTKILMGKDGYGREYLGNLTLFNVGII